LLPRAIQSVLDQKYKNLEIIVIDDGSTDETSQVVAKFLNPQMRYERFMENRGIGAARNTGVIMAKGELIAFIDSDDLWLPGKLNYMVGLFQRYTEVGLFFSDFLHISYLTGKRTYGFQRTKIALNTLVIKPLENEVYQIVNRLPEALLINNFIGTSSIVMIRSQVFQEIGNFLVNLSGPEDFEFYWRAAIRGVTFAYTTRPLVERHKDQESITASLVNFAPRLSKALDICLKTARTYQRPDLFQQINTHRLRIWQSVVREHACSGQRKDAWKAYCISLRYGVSLRTFLYLLASMVSPKSIQLSSKLSNALRLYHRILSSKINRINNK
jgi:glycosyltransferase involved in cell wall biosynthesis